MFLRHPLCIDNDSLVEKTHKRNFPNIPFINMHIRKLSSSEIQKYLDDGEIDIVIGDPPCQDFSTIGKRVSSNPEVRAEHDPRNELEAILKGKDVDLVVSNPTPLANCKMLFKYVIFLIRSLNKARFPSSIRSVTTAIPNFNCLLA